MADRIKLRRGPKSKMDLNVYELGYVTDSNEQRLYFNNGSMVPIPNQQDITSLKKSVAGIPDMTKQLNNMGNPSLLINGNFNNPVNSRGQAEYTSATNCLDKWGQTTSTFTTSIQNGFIRNQGKQISLRQYIEGTKQIFKQGSVFTISAKVKCDANREIKFSYIDNVTNKSVGNECPWLTAGTEWKIIKCTVTVTASAVNELRFAISTSWTETAAVTLDIEWIKLELGPVATPFIPRLYEEELALCTVNNVNNPNLFINGNFKNPVNQRGKTEYTANDYCIDRWSKWSATFTTSIQNGFIRNKGTWINLYQYIEGIQKILKRGTVFTMSAKVKCEKSRGVKFTYFDHTADKSIGEACPEITVGTDWQVISRTVTVNVDTVNQNTSFTIEASWNEADTATLDIEWMKLELSPFATPFVPRLYEEELALCQMNSASNPNLLINGYFQVWQKGTSFTGANVYTADRWKTNFNATVTNINGKAHVKANEQFGGLIQFIDFEDMKPSIQGSAITGTIKLNVISGSVDFVVQFIPKSSAPNITKTINVKNGVNSLTITAPNNLDDYKTFECLVYGNPNSEYEIEYMKVELGSVATPCIPRSYGEELALCQMKTHFDNAGLHEINDCHALGLEIGKQYLVNDKALNRPTSDNMWYTIEIKKAFDDNFMMFAYPLNNPSMNYYFCVYTPTGWGEWKDAANTKTLTFTGANLLNGWKIREDSPLFAPKLTISGNMANLALQLQVQSVTLTANGSVPFNIPVGYRPSHTAEVTGHTNTYKFISYDVATNGDLRIWLPQPGTQLTVGDFIPINITYSIK